MGGLQRITSLFVEGEAVYLGNDDAGQPVVVWVNKLNSFEVEEARRDGSARRGLRMAELGKDDNPERQGLIAEIRLWSDEKLAQNLVNQKADEIHLDVYNDLQTDPKNRERLDIISRLPQLLEDAGAPADDPRRAQVDEASKEWLTDLNAALQKALEDELRRTQESERAEVEAAYIENWRQRETLDVFMAERQTTQVFFALRECRGADVSTDLTKRRWDHSACDHRERMLIDREEVRQLPDAVLEKVIEAIERITIGPREAGNLDAPASSSASSEQPRQAEAPSTLSTPGETSSEPPTS